jgi:pimeloyl-ACP methyl ester carboxylesterase
MVKFPPWHPAILAVMSSLLLPGCGSLAPYEDIAAGLPADRLIQIDGQRVHVERWGDSGPHLVLLHGFAASTYSFHKLGPLLGKDHRVVAIDLNGFGYTERPAGPEAYSIDGQVRMITGVCEQLDISRAHLVGHSFGGQLALQIADRHPERVERLVLISPPTDLGEVPWPLRFGAVREALYPAVRFVVAKPARFRKILAGAYHQEKVLTDEVVEAYRQRLAIEGLRHAYRGFGQSLSANDDGDAIPTPGEPVLIIAGLHDTVVPLAEIRKFAAGLPGAELRILEHSGHSSPEEEPDALAEIMARFLAR